MASKNGRPRGSRGPQRIKSDALQEFLKQMRALPLDEVAVVRAGATEMLAAADGYSDRPQNARDRCIFGLSEADLCKREATGTGIRKVQDYKDFKPDWAPSVTSIYSEFPSFQHALAEAKLLNDLQPLTHIGVVDGRPEGGGKTHTDEDFVRALARCYEEMRGRRFSWDAYREFRRSYRLDLPGPEQFTKAKSGSSWDQWLDAAADFIVQEGPGCGCSTAYDFISRSRAAAKSAKGAV